MIVPGNRFEYLEAQAALDAVDARELDPEIFRPGTLDVLAQHILAIACAGPFIEAELLAEVRSAAPYAGLTDDVWRRVLEFIATGGYALRAYDKFRRLVEDIPGHWRITRPQVIAQHRLNAGIIVDNPMMDVRFKNGRMLGKVEEGFASTLTPGDHIFFAGLSLEVERFKDSDIIVHASSKPARIVTYGGQRMSMSTHLAERVRNYLASPARMGALPRRRPRMARGPATPLAPAAARRTAGRDLPARRPPLHGDVQLRRLERPPVARHADHQAHGESPASSRLGFVANDYAIAVYGLEPITDPAPLLSPDILEQEFVEWVEQSQLLKRAFREVAVIGGLVERQHPGKRKTGRQVSFSTDLIYDVLRKYEPEHLLMKAAWQDARARMTELGRLARLVERAAAQMVHVAATRVTPMAVPLMVIVGREALPPGAADEALLIEAEALAAEAMRLD